GHFGVEAVRLPIVAEAFPAADHPNVQMALDAYLAAPGRSATVAGITAVHEHLGVSLSHLVAEGGGLFGGQPPDEGPVEYVNIGLEDGRVLACVQRGVFFIDDGNERLVALVSGPSKMMWRSEIRVEVMAKDRVRAERLLSELRSIARSRSVYRGHVVSLEQDEMRALHVKFHRLAEIARNGIVLPHGLLDRIERSTLRFAAQRERLKRAGRHMKRGILFHGPPGTGKTLTAMYLAGQMRDRTVLLLTGRALGLIEPSCAMARTLEPSMLIVEDVDLIAEERDRQTPGCTALLFELLNQMDGLADDADVLFVLTTNRPDALEPALASRPGRVDEAIEFPLPDAEGRRRLFELYGEGLTMQLAKLDGFIHRTEHASPAFIRELLRKAALFAAEDGDPLVVRDRHVDDALHDLVVHGGELTMSLLGARQGRPAAGRDAPT
ncbi:MAG TPA: AAA family ATPase, partial [Candidatus Binatia bacterium]|nr:AAA family ATPase [Candidatus Binatia bacterium]